MKSASQHSTKPPHRPAAGADSTATARSIALTVLDSVERDGALADVRLEQEFKRVDVDRRERALAWELVYGVLRRRATLDWRLAQVSNRSINRLPVGVVNALRMAAYQLLFLDRIPPSAAVNESVNLVKMRQARNGQDWSGYVNGVLRGLARNPAPPYPDSRMDAAIALAIQYSCPEWLVARWLARFGKAAAEILCRATLADPPITIRVNQLKTTRDALQTTLRQSGHHSQPTRFSPIGLTLERRMPVMELPLFEEGAFYIEDEAAQLVPLLLDPRPGERVLDACAAPGGKTTHMAALMQNQGEIIAMDRSLPRLRLLEDNCRRLGVRIVLPTVGDAMKRSHTGTFDRILVDAPCSGLGILRRHPEGKWQKTAGHLPDHHRRQVDILDRMSTLVRPGGVLVYSTCSSEPEENEQVIDEFCHRHGEFQREAGAALLPANASPLLTPQGDLSTVTMLSSVPDSERGASMDAFFAARLRKRYA